MASIKLTTTAGKASGDVDLDDGLFGVQPHIPVMHQVVTAQLAAKRAGTQSTKTRAEVRGGGAKPWRQKGTGRARAGSIRSPLWPGGGIIHGPRAKTWHQRVPQQVRRTAFASALTDRARAGAVRVVELEAFEAPKTKRLVEALGRWDAADGR